LDHLTQNLPSNVELIKNARLTQLSSSNGDDKAHCEVMVDNNKLEKFETKMFINAAG